MKTGQNHDNHPYIIPSLEFLKVLAVLFTFLYSCFWPFFNFFSLSAPWKTRCVFFQKKKPKDVGDGEGEDDRLSSLQLRGFSRFSRSSSTLGLRRSGSTLRRSSSRRTSNKTRVPWLQMVNLRRFTRKKLKTSIGGFENSLEKILSWDVLWYFICFIWICMSL